MEEIAFLYLYSIVYLYPVLYYA